MNRFSDQSLARIMLDLRQRGISFGLHIRRNSKFYGLFIGYFCVFLAVQRKDSPVNRTSSTVFRPMIDS